MQTRCLQQSNAHKPYVKSVLTGHVQILAQWKQLSTLRQAVLPTCAATAAMSLLIQQTGNIDWTMLWKITDSASAIMTINITTLIDSIYTWYKATREQAATG
jgi:hypothetical protein